MKKTNHYICNVYDSINNYEKIGSSYCDVTTNLKAIKYFKSDKFIKKFIGNKRYQIEIRQNAILFQDSYEYLQNWKKQK